VLQFIANRYTAQKAFAFLNEQSTIGLLTVGVVLGDRGIVGAEAVLARLQAPPVRQL
jgi:hypothetical protein